MIRKSGILAIALYLSILVPLAQAKSRKMKIPKVIDQMADVLVEEPRDQEVCFTPGERCEAKLIKFVRSAKLSVDVAIYDINLERLVKELLQAAKSIPVRVVVDRKQAKGEKSLVKQLIQDGVEIRFGRQRGIMHNKFIIVDGRGAKPMVETGSFNFTNGAANANNENQIYLANPNVVERYRKRFEAIWEQADRVSSRRFE